MKIALKLGNTTESSNNNMTYTSMPRPGIYNVMIRASAFERDGLLVSLLYPYLLGRYPSTQITVAISTTG